MAMTPWLSGIRCPLSRASVSSGTSGMPGPEAGVWATLVVVSHPLPQNESKMPFIQEDQPIQTLSTDGADHSFAERVRLRAPHRRLQYRQARRGDRAIYGRRIDAVAIVNEEALRLIAGNNGAELLDGPFGRGMLRDIPMHDPARANFKDDEHVRCARRSSTDGTSGDREGGHRWPCTASPSAARR